MPNCSVSTSPEFLQSPDSLKLTLYLLSSLSIPIYTFGAYCILFKTPQQMSDMKWAMLNFHCWSVAFDLAVGFLFIPYLQIPALGGIGLGILSDLGMHLGDQTYLGMSFMGGVIVSVTCLFETRYFLLYGEGSTWKYIRRPWLAANYFLAFAYMVPTYISFPDQLQGKAELFEYIPCLPDFLLEDKYFIVTVHRGRVAMNVGVLVIPVPLESVFFVCIIYKNMRKMKKLARLSKKTLSLQRKFLSALILQVTLPYITMLVPIYLFEYSILKFHYNQGLNNLSIMIISMHGAVSSVAMILLHKPYRDVVLGCVKWRKKSVAPKISEVLETRT